MQNLPLKNIRYLILPRSESAPHHPVAAVQGAEVIRVGTKLRPESFKNDQQPGNLTQAAKYRIGLFCFPQLQQA